MAPSPAKGEGQDRGNSGVFLMELYEVQVLDCYNNKTYADGQTAAIYGQYPPLVNACRPPGEWQTYDIVFHRPRFDEDGKVVSPGPHDRLPQRRPRPRRRRADGTDGPPCAPALQDARRQACPSPSRTTATRSASGTSGSGTSSDAPARTGGAGSGLGRPGLF